MAIIETKKIRNVALLGHGGSGKTSLAEAMLFISGGTDRFGSVGAGTTVSDYDPEEINRKISLFTATAPITWKDCKINIIDNPGFPGFLGETMQGLRAADAAILVVDARAGIEVGTELSWQYATEAGLSKAFFINKFDDNEARFAKVLDALHEKFGKSVCPLTIPMVKDGAVDGVIDLIDQTAHIFNDKGQHSVAPIPEESKEATAKYRDMLMEAVATTDEELMNKYFAGEEISHMEAVNAVHEGIIHGDIVPLFCGAATKLWGVWTLLDKIYESFPRHTAKKNEKILTENGVADKPIEPEGQTAIFVYKTVSDPFVGRMSYFKVMNGEMKRDMILTNAVNGAQEKIAHLYTVKGKTQTEVDALACGDLGMIAKAASVSTDDTLTAGEPFRYVPVNHPVSYMEQAIIPVAKGDEDKISQALARIAEEDKTLRFENNAETGQMIVTGMGDLHLAVLASRLKSRFGVNVRMEAPRIAYRERITKAVKVQGKHKKQSGGHGQYGDVWIEFKPSDTEGLTFTESCVGGSVPKNFHPAVQKGLEEAMLRGTAGYPMTRLSANLYDGSYHDVDSNELSFKVAASLAYKAMLKEAAPVLLEPVGNLAVTVPETMVGDVMSDLNKRRGTVTGYDSARPGYTVVEATIPKAEIVDYTVALRALTQGRATYTFALTGYAQVPPALADTIRAAYKNEE